MNRKGDTNNRANQMNPNNEAYWTSRGCDERLLDWEERSSADQDRVIQRRGSTAFRTRATLPGVRNQRLPPGATVAIIPAAMQALSARSGTAVSPHSTDYGSIEAEPSGLM